MKKKTRVLPTIEGIKAPFFFHKDPNKAELALMASFITENRRQGWKKDVTTFYESAARKGELGTLQKFLGADDCETTTDGKLFHAYKLALADSDELFGLLTDAFCGGPPLRSGMLGMGGGLMIKCDLSEVLWMLAGVYQLGRFLSIYGATPPTLARVRFYFGRAYPQNAGLWPNDKDTNHDMARKFRKWKLPLARGKAGRPRNRASSKNNCRNYLHGSVVNSEPWKQTQLPRGHLS